MFTQTTESDRNCRPTRYGTSADAPINSGPATMSRQPMLKIQRRGIERIRSGTRKLATSATTPTPV